MNTPPTNGTGTDKQQAQERSMATQVTEMATKINELADRLGKEAGFKEASIIHAISVAKKARMMARNVIC